MPSKRSLALLVLGLFIAAAGFALPVAGYHGSAVGADVALGAALAIFGLLGLRKKIEI